MGEQNQQPKLCNLPLEVGRRKGPCDRTAVIAGAHIDWMTTSPEAIRFTLSLKSLQKALNCPDFLASVNIFIVRSISALVMFPLSGYVYSPMASTTIAASIMPIEGIFKIHALPLNSGSRVPPKYLWDD